MRPITTLLFALSLVASAALAQEQPVYNTVKDFKNRMFTLQHRDPRTVVTAVRLLGSGFQGAGLQVNEELRTITVRDFPENIAAIEEAVKRLDRPAAQGPDIEMRIYVLIGSKSAVSGSPLPDELVPVVKQLQSTLSFTHFGLMTTALHRTRPGSGIEGSGVAEPTLFGTTASLDRPLFLGYAMRNVSLGPGDAPTVEIASARFNLRVPLNIGGDKVNIQYQDVGFETPVSLRPREKVVIGTTTMKDKALIVVLTANVNP